MPDIEEVKESLLAIADLWECGAIGWCKYHLAEDSNDVEVNELDPKAVSFCAMGAAYLARVPDPFYVLSQAAGEDIVDFNNHPSTIKKDMIAAASRVQREAREAVYAAVSKFDATTMHNKRAELSEAIQKELQKGLDTSDRESFVVTTINVRNLVTD